MKEFLQVLRRFVPPYKKYLVLSVIFNILSAVLNIFSFAALIPILQILFQTGDAEEATCLDFLLRGINYCDYLDTKRMRFLAGTHQDKGRTVEDYGSYPVSKAVLKDLKQAREDFVEAYNGFFTPKIAASPSKPSRSFPMNIPSWRSTVFGNISPSFAST